MVVAMKGMRSRRDESLCGLRLRAWHNWQSVQPYPLIVTCAARGIPLATLDEQPKLDVAIDGADEVDPALNVVKGRGGALLREMVEM